MSEATLSTGSTTEEVEALMKQLPQCNPILASRYLTPMELLFLLPLNISPSLYSMVNLLRGMQLPAMIEDELLIALLARGEIGEVPNILRRYWGESLYPEMQRVSNVNSRNRRGELASARKRFLRDLTPGLENIIHESTSVHFTEHPPYLIYEALYGENRPPLTPQEQLDRVNKHLGHMLSSDPPIFHPRHVAQALDEEMSVFARAHGDAEVERAGDALLATKLRYMNGYYRGEESAQGYIAAMALTLDGFSLDLLVNFHALAEEYNFEWAMASFPGFSSNTSPLLERMNDVVATVPGLEWMGGE